MDSQEASTGQESYVGSLVSQSLFSAVKVLDPEMVRSKEIGIYTYQAYWSLKNQKANDQANCKVNYDLTWTQREGS